MRWISSVLSRFRLFLRKRFKFISTYPYITCFVESDLPSKLRRNTIYIIQEDGFLEYASMLCPCGCRKILYMNLIPDERPCWHLQEHLDGTVSLYPSVWRQKDCYSHFWFKCGRVYWCKTSRRFWWQRILPKLF